MLREIINVHPKGYPLSASEVIPKDSLRPRMTSHGLGSGIYGFIDEKKAQKYTKSSDEMIGIILENPLVLSSDEDLTQLTFVSILLNKSAYEISKVLTDDPKKNMLIAKKIFAEECCKISNLGECKDKEPFIYFNEKDIVPVLDASLLDMFNAVLAFVNDYMNIPEDSDMYVKMPINYLLDSHYDGIYNLAADDSSSGSLLFSYENGRSFIASGKSKILTGGLYQNE